MNRADPFHSETKRLRLILRTIVIAIGVLEMWAFRYLIFSDGIQYLEIAEKFARGAWTAAVNSYWPRRSPRGATEVLYPLVRDGIASGLYFPNRQSLTCSRRNCAFWRQCEPEFGGSVAEA
jgi:hypothetical protein